MLANMYSTNPPEVHRISAFALSGMKKESELSSRPIIFSRVARPQVGTISAWANIPMGTSISAMPSSRRRRPSISTRIRSWTRRHRFCIPCGPAR